MRRLEHNAFKVALAQCVAVRALQPPESPPEHVHERQVRSPPTYSSATAGW
jgi:hypothetical protein